MKNEIWLPVVGYEGLYEISSHGRLKTIRPRGGCNGGSIPRSKDGILRPGKNTCGYLQATLFDLNSARKRIHIAELVLTAFVGARPEGHQAGHKNAIRDDNRKENLEWQTPQQNMDQRTDDGHTRFGEAHGMSKITEAEAAEIIDLKGFITQENLSILYGLSRASISFIQNGKTWKHLTEKRMEKN